MIHRRGLSVYFTISRALHGTGLNSEDVMSDDQDNFAHGAYGDDAGVVFYGPPVSGWWDDRLDVSSRFIEPIFNAIIDRSFAGATLPRIVAEWNALTGWRDAEGPQEIPPADAIALIDALSQIDENDTAPHLCGNTSEQCVRCAGVIARFLRERVGSGRAVYIEDD
jgi:hypothetical protein